MSEVKGKNRKTEESGSSEVLPHKLDLERAVLGTIIINPKMFYSVSVDLKPDDFFFEANRRIFRVMGELLEAKKPIDLITLTLRLEEKHEVDQVGGAAYVSALIDGVPDSPNLDTYIADLREVSRRRQLVGVCNRANVMAQDPGEPINWTISGLYEDILRIQGDAKRKTGQFLHEFSTEVLNAITEEMYSTREVIGLPFGIANVDEETTGIRKGELCICAGWAGSGKTAFLLNIASTNVKQETPVCIFSREMRKEQLLLRLWSAESDIPYNHLRNPKNLAKTDYKELKAQWIPKVSSWPLLIDDEAVMIDDIIARAHLYHMKYKTELFIVDYVQIIGSKLEKEYERVSECCDKLTQFAKETGIPIVVSSQLTRPERRERGMNIEPNMMMLRASGKLEHNAHLILLLHHPMGDDHQPTGEDLIIIGKQRAGSMGRKKAYFDVRCQKWMERGEQEKAPAQTSFAADAAF